MKCTEISSLLVDFLYEEMPPAQRGEFLAHVAGCASCSAEVKAMSSTLGHARAALRGPLAEDPPARVRARVLQAARAAVAVQSTDRAGPRIARAPQPEGFFARLWKTPWLVPALGAAGVATAVFLVKVITNPQVLPERKPAATEAFIPPAAEPQRLQQSQPQPEAPAAPAVAAQGLAMKPTTRTERDSRAESKRAAIAGKLRSSPPDRDGLATSRRHVDDDPLAGVTWERAPLAAATVSKGGGKAGALSRGAADAITKPEPAPAMRAEKDEAGFDEPLRPVPQARKAPIAEAAGSSDRWAQPPAPRPAAAPVVAAPAAARSAPAEEAKPVADS